MKSRKYFKQNANKLVQELYKTKEYFVKIPSDSNDFEENYWGKTADPDGNERNRFKEFDSIIPQFDYIIDYLKNKKIKNLLDIGCGSGILLAAIKKSGIVADLHGLDISKYAAQHASQFAKIFTGDLTTANYLKDQFDVVVSHHVIEHVPDPLLFVKNIKKILKKNGILILATPDFDSATARLFGAKYRMLHDPTHINLFSNDSMHRLLRDNSFDIDYVEYPYFKTKFFNKESLKKLFDNDQVSPPFYGNFMTFFSRKS